ncbi:MAG: NADP-dependent phosphogluconate dehydrogenase, partial [Janthinobacterium lividum]
MSIEEQSTQQAQIGVTGLATMGRNLARNIARHGYVTAVHNRSDSKTKALVEEFGDEGTFIPATTAQEFVDSLESPRTIIIMVKAGGPTDAVIDEIAPLLSEGDILVDAGNAHFADTRRREAALREQGIHFAGVGVSGGEEGALLGPSIMPGGSEHAYAKLGPIFADIAVTVDGTPCSTHVGADGAGHFVKMVHNGIEYADMQLIAEAYDLLRHGLGRTPKQLAEVFRSWNEGDLDSFLIEITARVLDKEDPSGAQGRALIDVILDEAEQKGTGRWTVQTALDLGTPVSGIAEAVFARALSGHAEQRKAAQGVLPGPAAGAEGSGGFVDAADADAFIDDVRAALYASKVVAYAQGFDMIRAGSVEYGWDVDPGAMA